VFLVGMMGAGKSSVAKDVAAQLGWAVADTDDVVEHEAGMTVAHMFADLGEEAFRDAEAGAIQHLSVSAGPVVVSVGGGAVLRPENRVAMGERGTVVWLRARPGTLAARVGRGEKRPLLARAGTGAGDGTGGGRGLVKVLAGLSAERRHLYEEVADVVVDVDELTVAQVARLVVAKLSALPG
jgi:shikimate kinase